MVELQTSPQLDILTTEFARSIATVTHSPEKMGEMITVLREFNPNYQPVEYEFEYPQANILAEVVAAVYAPFIHAFSNTILSNIKMDNLPKTVMFPPRDAIPLMESMTALANLHGISFDILSPAINRNTAGIYNNQNGRRAQPDHLLEGYFAQLASRINSNPTRGVVELETGVYGTTSLVTAQALKNHGVLCYIPIKFYGLGPNISFVHALLSNGGEWTAEKAEANGLVDSQFIHEKLMVLLDSMEELGMEKYYQSVEELYTEPDGGIYPVIEATLPEELCIAHATNKVIRDTAQQYVAIDAPQAYDLIKNTPWLIEQSKQGLPITLTAPIPSMDSKDAHFAHIRSLGVFDYPALVL